MKALTREQLGLMLFAVPDRWRPFFELLTHSGLRIGEAIGLRWEHVDLGESPRLLIREQIYRGKRRKLKSRAGKRDIPPASLPSCIGRDALHPAREAAGLEWVTFLLVPAHLPPRCCSRRAATSSR